MPLWFPPGSGIANVVIGTSAIAGGTNKRLLFNDSGVVADSAFLAFEKTFGSLAVGGATVTTSNPILNLTQTWNAGAVAFTGLKLNVTDTASSASSYLMDLQVAGSSKFNITKAGGVSVGGAMLASSLGIGFAGDLNLYRDAANVLAQYNGANAQGLKVFNKRTDASNGEWGVFDWTTTTDVLTIGTKANGTGAAKSINIDVGSSTVISLTSSLMRFAGATSSFPALKRSSAALQARLADDSAFAMLQAKHQTDNAYSSGAPTATGYVTIYDSAGTALRVLVANP